jgi:DNA-directed RNA polymerase sigma subunit (sigma70/sigma32)
MMYEAFKALTEEEIQVIRAYYGLDGEPKTYDQLELETGIPRERLRRKEARALIKMWRHMRQKAPSLCE